MYNARIRMIETPDVQRALELNISIKRTMVRSGIRLATTVAGTALVVYVVAMIPGLFFLVLPGLIALSGKAYDEARLIQYLKYGEPLTKEHWDDVEAQTERIRIRSSENRGVSMTN